MASNEIIRRAKHEGRKYLTELEAKQILAAHSIPCIEGRLAKSENEAVSIAESFGYPVVMKIVSPDILHKSDIGGVFISVRNSEEVKVIYQKLLHNAHTSAPDAKVIGVVVERQAQPGIEVLIGMKKDPQFGPAIAFGLGGIFVELLKDVSFRVAPLDATDAKEMIDEIKGAAILNGYRGKRGDKKALEELLLNLSKFVIAHPQVAELDLNPVIVYEQGAIVVDARIILE